MVMEEDELRDSMYVDVASFKTTVGRIFNLCLFVTLHGYYTDGY